MDVEYLVARFFRYRDVLRNRLHFGILQLEEFLHRVRNFFAEPAKFGYYCETVRFNRLCPSVQSVSKTDVVGCAFCPKQIDFGKTLGMSFISMQCGCTR